ncbi:AbrB/MazE/SpoVT family DNA-binding domain-containing protein [Halalkalibacterium halodurans]|uniref:AbrB/MazE/SpoVT family DNA-binding domain-containing protein n=1 Tax=Halalkalibacterium halodurans TaxID=86665 RepID=UPI0010678D73|nr:AbrB/MazE/SpoVT family DNA-binding domain-containing protein [Halalkalibacterium halodurans]MED3648610.1 AbrB/MazE/SpoVT family DNA-binding domain-containing protein [Halalkalibacterium halodurans]TES47593.1 AbrB/MazE/SpoVT family DNA-binding domain-containing protein [Halalkalibacterium halodurans]
MSVEMLEKKEKRYTRRINQVGNSLSVGIPKDITKALQMNKGDEIEVSFDEERGEIVMKKVNRSIPNGVRPEVLQAMNRAIGKYDNALRNLRDR